MPDIVTGKVFVDGEKGITATKLNQIQSLAVIQPSFYSGKPSTSSLDPTDTLLDLKSSGSYAQITGSQLISSVSSQINVTPQIYSVRLRSFNAMGNPNFEVDQVSYGATVAGANGKLIDRWAVSKSGTMVVSAGQNSTAAGDVCVPGTSFQISRNFYRITSTTAETTLGATDFLQFAQTIEGSSLRELFLDVHSISVLVRSSVAGLSFGISICDPSGTRSLCNLGTITSANTWTLLTFPNLPVFPPAGAFNITPGNAGYLFRICLAAGSTYTAPANGTWQNGNYIGALGQSNFAAQATSSTFDIAFCQHEPGSVCTTLIDKPFSQNLDECLRYYCKSYIYQSVAGTNTGSNGIVMLPIAAGATTWALGNCPYPKALAKAPTLSFYGADGTANAVTIYGAGDVSVNGNMSTAIRINGVSLTVAQTVGAAAQFHYTADTGW